MQNRMDSMGNVLQALLLVASQQLQQGSTTSSAQGQLDEGRQPLYLTAASTSVEDTVFARAIGRENQYLYNERHGISPPLSSHQPTREELEPSKEPSFLDGQDFSSSPKAQSGYQNSVTPGGWSMPAIQGGSRLLPITNRSRQKQPARTFTVESDTHFSQSEDDTRTQSNMVDAGESSLEVYTPNSEDPILAKLADMAEEGRYGDNYGIENFLQAAFFFYMKASTELDSEPGVVSKDAYLSLVKSSWIVNDLIRR
jgi:hypothetical protein